MGGSDSLAADYSIGNPTAGEQYLLELINRARLDPSAEATRLGIPLNQGVSGTITTASKQPLAFNRNLSTAARAHAQWMLSNNIFSHTGAYGTDPKTRMSNAGYSFTGNWGYGENLGLGSGKTTLQDYIDYVHWLLFSSPGHRVNMMTANHSEAGLATERGYYTYTSGRYDSLMMVENFASSDATPGPIILGVVYNDLDGDGFYDIGEGISGATLEITGAEYTATTTASGG